MNSKQAKSFVQRIRKRWNDPVVCPLESAYTGAYCVGGAFCRGVDYDGQEVEVDFIYTPAAKGRLKHQTSSKFYFPMSGTVAAYLRRMNPALQEENDADNSDFLSETFAETITALNDDAKYEKSWQELEKALAWKPKKKGAKK